MIRGRSQHFLVMKCDYDCTDSNIKHCCFCDTRMTVKIILVTTAPAAAAAADHGGSDYDKQ